RQFDADGPGRRRQLYEFVSDGGRHDFIAVFQHESDAGGFVEHRCPSHGRGFISVHDTARFGECGSARGDSAGGSSARPIWEHLNGWAWRVRNGYAVAVIGRRAVARLNQYRYWDKFG